MRVVAAVVAEERKITGGRVLPTGCVVEERIITGGRVLPTGCAVYERIVTQECVG